MTCPLDETAVLQMLVSEAQKHVSSSVDQQAPVICEPCPPPDAAGLCAAEQALGAVEMQDAFLGQQLHPLRSLDEIAALLELQLVFPSGMPRRARRMLDELRLVGVNVSTEYEVMQLLNRLEGSDRWTKALGMLRVPSERRVVLVPPVTCSTHGPYSFSRRHTFSSSSTVPPNIHTHKSHSQSTNTQKNAERCNCWWGVG